MRRTLVVVLLAAAVLVVSPAAPALATEDAAEGQFVSLTNGERSHALAVDAELTGIARRWSAKMVADNRLSHNPNLTSEVTQDWKKLGENVGVGNDPPQIHTAFMNSPGHRANIVDPDFTRIGVGVARGDDGRIWVTEVFMRLRSDDAPPPSSSPSGTTSNTITPSGNTGSPSNAPAPAPAPASASRPASPATTAPPRTRTTVTLRPAAPATTSPPSPSSSAPNTPAAGATAAAAAAPASAPPLSTEPSSRLVLVLEQLVALDRGR